jgi:hypothetical protein
MEKKNMFISYEELKFMEEKYAEEVRVAQSHLDVIRELVKFAEEKVVSKSEETEEVAELEEETDVEEIAQ